jgi:hypothetical protein
VAAAMVVILGALFAASRKTAVKASNVNDDWDDKRGGLPAPTAPARAAVPA